MMDSSESDAVPDAEQWLVGFFWPDTANELTVVFPSNCFLHCPDCLLDVYLLSGHSESMHVLQRSLVQIME